jgi:hypothetical protein
MSKVNIILIVLSVVLGIFAYNLWADGRKKDDEILSLGEKVNQAKVIEREQLDKIQALDSRLAKEINKERPVEYVYVEVAKVIEKEGDIKVVTEVVDGVTRETDEWQYKDFRLTVDINPTAKRLKYSLSQKFRINLYVLDDSDYRAEMAEIAPNGEVVEIYDITDFQVEKQRSPSSWHTGFNLMVGGGGLFEFTGKFQPTGHLLLNFISKGATHLDSDYRLLSVGAGTAGGVIAPFQYRISNAIPFFSDIFIDPMVGVSYKGKWFFGVGLSSTL